MRKKFVASPIETTELCHYGCSSVGKYLNSRGRIICADHSSKCPEIRRINSLMLKKSYADGSRQSGVDRYNSLPDKTKKKMAWSKGKVITPDSEIFIKDSNYTTEFLKKRILQFNIFEYKCSICGTHMWNGTTLVLDLDHINGNRTDNRILNLRFLCPNCHSQTPTYKGRNKNKKIIKKSDAELFESYLKHGNIRKALIAVGLAPSGGNYSRIKKLIATMVERNTQCA